MGRKMYIRHVGVRDEAEDIVYHHPGCISGLGHVLDYHHWRYNVSKMFHLKKYDVRSHTKGIVNPRSRTLDDSRELLPILDDNGSHFLVNKKTKHTQLANKRSIRVRIKGLIAKEPKQENDKKLTSGGSPILLLRTYSIHHREPSDLGLSDICKEKEHTIVFLPSSLDDRNKSLKVPNSPQPNSMNNNASEHHFKENVDGDLVELFKADKELFLKVVESTDNSTGKYFHHLPYFSSTKDMLTRSGSFPTSDLSRRSLKPSKLEDKKNEIWFSLGEKRFSDYTQAPELSVLKYKKHLRAKSWNSAYYSDYSRNGELKKDFVSMDEVSCWRAPSSGEEDTTGKSAQSAMDIGYGTDTSKCHELEEEDLHGKLAVLNHKGSSSFGGSLDRYSRLYEDSSRQEVNLHHSKSLKLRNEYNLPPGGHVSFRRIRSLSNLDFWYPIQNEEPTDARYHDWPLETARENSSVVEGDLRSEEIRASIPVIVDNNTMLDASKEAANELVETDNVQPAEFVASLSVANEVSRELDDFTADVVESRVDKGTIYLEEDVNYLEIGAEMLPDSFLHSNRGASFQDEASDEYLSQGMGNICNNVDENDFNYMNSEQTSRGNAASDGIMKQENFEAKVKDGRNFCHPGFNEGDSAKLYYVREVLERSGIDRYDALNAATWHSLDQPVSPSVFEEMETSWHNELDFSEEDVNSCFRHQLLFDLVNEEIVQMCNRSFTYYPKALSSSCRVCPLRAGNHIIDQVTASISISLNRKPERHHTLDNIVSRDLAEDDGWMNLQFESECVALELEDMMFDEILEGILSY